MIYKNKKQYFIVDYNNYSGNGCVRDVFYDKNDARIKKERGDIYIFHDDKLGFSRVLYTDKKTADNVLLMMMID